MIKNNKTAGEIIKEMGGNSRQAEHLLNAETEHMVLTSIVAVRALAIGV